MKIIKVATAIIYKNQKILMLHRSSASAHFAGYWQLPEGKMELNERPIETIKRELYEETRLVPLAASYLGAISTTVDVDDNLVTARRILFSAEINNLEIRLSHEHDDFRWVKLASVCKMKLYPGTDSAVSLFRKTV